MVISHCNPSTCVLGCSQSDGCKFNQTVPSYNRTVPIMIGCFPISVVSEIHLVLYNYYHIDQALRLISNDERFTQILTLNLLPTNEGEEPVPVAANVDPIIEDAIESDPLVEGVLPGAHPDQREYSTTASLSLGLDNQEAYRRLSTYLHQVASLDAIPVGLDRACLFSSMRRVFDATKEYTSVHLRRQLVITLQSQGFLLSHYGRVHQGYLWIPQNVRG